MRSEFPWDESPAERLAPHHLAHLKLLHEGLATLSDKPEEDAESTLCALMHLVSGTALSAQAAIDMPLPSLDASNEHRLIELIGRRVEGVPLAHLTQRQRFMGFDILAGPAALIPRRETEQLGYAALDLLQTLARGRSAVVVADACTGSGNLAVALARNCAQARVFAADLSGEAAELAKANIDHFGLGRRVTVLQGDLLEPFVARGLAQHVDLLVCNPPYISHQRVDAMPAEIGDFEPRLAFDGGPFGVTILHRLIRRAPDVVRPGGWLAFEVGLGQGKSTLDRLRASGRYGRIDPVHDVAGDVRAVCAQVVEAVSS